MGCLVFAACAGKARYFSVEPKDLGSPRAKATAYFGGHKEMVPPELPHDIVLDEATLMASADGAVCMDVILRTFVGFDEPIDRLEPWCKVDGDAQDVHIEEIARQQRDYQFVGTFDKAKLKAMGRAGMVNFSQNEQRPSIFSVIERRANVCCHGTMMARSLVFELKNPRMKMKETVAFSLAVPE